MSRIDLQLTRVGRKRGRLPKQHIVLLPVLRDDRLFGNALVNGHHVILRPSWGVGVCSKFAHVKLPLADDENVLETTAGARESGKRGAQRLFTTGSELDLAQTHALYLVHRCGVGQAQRDCH